MPLSVCPLFSTEFVESLPNKISGYATDVCTPKNTVFLVTKSIYDKTDLFRIISLCRNAEVCFEYLMNYCDAKQTKIWDPQGG